MNTSRRLSIILIVIIVLAGVQWYLNSRPSAFFNQYGTEATTIAATSLENQAAPSSAVKPVTSTVQPAQTTNNSTVKNFMNKITIQTNKGSIIFETYDADAPNTVKNFIALTEKGFYNNLIFHRVIAGFMIQGGDPTGTGTGGPGYKFADELNPSTESYKAGYVRGTVAMANSGPDTNGSQFFIMQKDNALPHNYTIFGKVISGMDVVDAIAGTAVDAQDKPVQNIVMTKVTASAR